MKSRSTTTMPVRAAIGLVLMMVAAFLAADGIGWHRYGPYDPMEPQKLLVALGCAAPALLLLATADGKPRSPLVVAAFVGVALALLSAGLFLGLAISLVWHRPSPSAEWIAFSTIVVAVLVGTVYLYRRGRD